MEETALIKQYLLDLIKDMDNGKKTYQEVADLSQEVYDALDEKEAGKEHLFNQLIEKLRQ